MRSRCYRGRTSTNRFSKNRHGRFQQSQLFEQLFEQIVQQCVEVGLVRGTHLSGDGSFVEAKKFFLAAAAQNIKRLVRFLSKVPSPNLAATA